VNFAVFSIAIFRQFLHTTIDFSHEQWQRPQGTSRRISSLPALARRSEERVIARLKTRVWLFAVVSSKGNLKSGR